MKWLNIVAFIVLCSSCGEKSEDAPKASEASLEEAVNDARKLFSDGDAEAVADLFVVSGRLTQDHIVELASDLTKSESPLSFKFESCKVSGNMGIVLLSFSRAESRLPFFTKWENGKWRVFFDPLAWQEPRLTRKMDLTESEMEDALILQKWAFSQPFAGASGINAHDRLGWYVPYVPKDLKIEKFYETPSPSMDHDYMWKIKLEDNEEFKKFSEQFLKPPPNVDGVNDLSEVLVFHTHPDWWREIRFDKHKVHQYRVVVVGSNGGEKGHLFAMFDRDEGFLYVQAF